MALYGMADNNIAIPAKRDGAIYNAFARNSDFVVEGIGDEFAMTSSTTSFVLTLGTGEGIICGRHVTEVTEDNVNSVLQLEANSQGYIVIRMDLTRPSGSECYLTAVSTVTREDLNDTGTIADLVLYGYVTGSNGVTSFVDMRNIRNASAVAASEVTYSNTSSGLSATNVQGAIDRVYSQAGLDAMINTLPEAGATPADDDFYVSQATGITPNNTYVRRKMRALAAYIQNKFFGFTAGSGTINTTYCSSGTISWKKAKIGSVYVCNVTFDCTFKSSFSSDNVAIIGTGTPTPAAGGYIVAVYGTSTTGQCCVNFDSGKLRPWFCGTVSGHWYGAVSFISNS